MYFVLFGPFGPILSTFFQFSSPWSSSVHFGLIQTDSYSILSIHFGPIRSIRFILDLLRSIWSYSVHSVNFVLIRSFRSNHFTLVLFDLIRSNLVQLCPYGSICFTLVLFGPFYPLRSYSVHIGPISSTLIY